MAFSVKIPPILHRSAVEGLCGQCAGPLETEDKEMTEMDIKKYRAPASVLKKLDIQEDECMEKPKEKCWPPPPNEDPCLKILDQNRFGKVRIKPLLYMRYAYILSSF